MGLCIFRRTVGNDMSGRARCKCGNLYPRCGVPVCIAISSDSSTTHRRERVCTGAVLSWQICEFSDVHVYGTRLQYINITGKTCCCRGSHLDDVHGNQTCVPFRPRSRYANNELYLVVLGGVLMPSLAYCYCPVFCLLAGQVSTVVQDIDDARRLDRSGSCLESIEK